MNNIYASHHFVSVFPLYNPYVFASCSFLGLPSGSCTTNPCKNGAECEQHKQYYYCRCSDIYSGFHCEGKI